MDINTKINMCLYINFAIGADAYALEVSKHTRYCCYRGRRVTCTRMLDVPDEIVQQLYKFLVVA